MGAREQSDDTSLFSADSVQSSKKINTFRIKITDKNMKIKYKQRICEIKLKKKKFKVTFEKRVLDNSVNFNVERIVIS